MVWELKKSQKTWNYYLLDRKMSKMPSLSRDTDITKFGGENVQKWILSLLIAFFNVRNSNHKHTCVEHIPFINFVFYPVKLDALPILQKCPRNFGSSWIDLIKLVNIPHSCFLCLLFSLFVCFHQRSNEIGVEAMMVLEQSVSRGSPASKQVSAPAESSNALLPLTNTLLCSALNLLHSAWPLCPSETLLSPFPHIQLELLERE